MRVADELEYESGSVTLDLELEDAAKNFFPVR
jgi:hypothetical protein